MSLLKKNGYIEHNVFSIYTSTQKGKSSHIILGGIDNNGIKEGETMSYVKTVNNTIWSVQFEKVKFN